MPTCLGLFGSTPLPRLNRYCRSGRNFLVTVPPSGPLSFWEDSSPPVLDGDFAAVEKTTSRGHVITVGADGIAIIQSPDTSGQSVHVDSYSRHLLRWLRDSTQFINDQGPVAQASVTINLTVGVPYSINVGTLAFTDPEGDALEIDFVLGNLPPDSTFANGVLASVKGPHLILGDFFTIEATDTAGNTAQSVIIWNVVSEVTQQIAGPLVNQPPLKDLTGGALAG